MDKISHNTQNTFTFIDNILFVTKGSKQQHLDKEEEVLKILDEAGFRLKEDKCKNAQTETERLGFKLTASEVAPIAGKVQAITDKSKLKNLKALLSFMVAINQMNRFIPNLAQLCATFRPLLSKDTTWEWKAEHDTEFDKIKSAIQGITELHHFKRDKPLRIVCDASKEGLGAVLQQKTGLAGNPLCIEVSNHL